MGLLIRLLAMFLVVTKTTAMERTQGKQTSTWNPPSRSLHDPNTFKPGSAFQMIRSVNDKGEDIITQRLLPCGVEK
jgi:hypothetical protein